MNFVGPHLGQTVRTKICFFAIFLSLAYQFSWKLHRMIAWNNVQLLTYKNHKKYGEPILELAWDDRLEQCLTISRGKAHEKKKLGAQIWTKIGARIRFLPIFSSLVHQFSFKFYRMIAQHNVELVEMKLTQKIGGPKLGQKLAGSHTSYISCIFCILEKLGNCPLFFCIQLICPVLACFFLDTLLNQKRKLFILFLGKCIID